MCVEAQVRDETWKVWDKESRTEHPNCKDVKACETEFKWKCSPCVVKKACVLKMMWLWKLVVKGSGKVVTWEILSIIRNWIVRDEVK